MQPSTVTAHHHMHADPFGVTHILELRDHAVPVDVLTPFDWNAQVTITKYGVPTTVIVCCGPSAPLPQVPATWRLTEPAEDMTLTKPVFLGPTCGFLGPDGIECQLSANHARELGEVLHAYVDLDGLVKW